MLLLLLGIGLGELLDIERQLDPESLDAHVEAWVARHRDDRSGLTRLARAASGLGNVEIAIPAVVVVALVLYGLGRRGHPRTSRGEAGFWLLVAGSGWLLGNLLKLWFQRERPPLAQHLTTYSFPSGHSVFSAVFFTLLAILLARWLPSSLARLRPVVAGSCFLLALLISASRVWLGAHYLTDVIAGFLLGLLWATLACLIRFGGSRFRRWIGLRSGAVRGSRPSEE
ncbi:MAG: phosphatase PAP2 family protein [Isosphaeraceae bacterium]|nr:phosphatase PAP2 family protein [Isosphaeraceae bacterium]